MTLKEEIDLRKLPELLRFADSAPVKDAKDWSRRREEIRQLLRREYMGSEPENISMTYRLTGEDKDAYGGKAVGRSYLITLKKEEISCEFPFRVIIPKAGEDPFPVFLHLHFNEQPGGGLGEEIIDNGFALAHVCYQDIAPDNSEELFAGVCGFDRECRGDRWGKIGVWAYGAGRIMDCLQEMPELDHSRIAVIGHSRLGLTALWCGAMDERFSLSVGVNSGSFYRRSAAESFRDLARDYTRHWFCPDLFRDDRDAEDLPFDMHFLLALAAPRCVYLTGATRDLWTDAHSQVLAGIAASPVYELLGQKGLVCPEVPKEDTAYPEGNIGFYLREGTHFLGRDDWHRVMDFRRQKNV